MSEPHGLGAIVTATEIVRRLEINLALGLYDDLDTVLLVKRAARHLEKSCMCELSVCCGAHGRHVDPHRECFLR